MSGTKTLREFIETAQAEEPETPAQAQVKAAERFQRHLSKEIGSAITVKGGGKGVLNVSNVSADDPEKFKHIMASLSRFAHANNYEGIRIKDAKPGSVATIKAHGFDDDKTFYSPNGVTLLKAFKRA